jgi:hypothetical protein
MANELEAAATAKVQGVTNNTITGRVYLTAQLSSTAEDKAAELSILMQELLAYGVYESALDAAREGVPTGTFVVIDNPITPEGDFSVEVVPYLAGGRPVDGGDFEVVPRV